jgi:predicted RNA-binding Zn-ribbon protein involved in translation (DUF1610 family)
MVALFGPSEPDLERLRATVQSLGVTSVPGLAAALAWRERKAEKLLAHELARPGTPLVYDPGRRVVRWARPLPDLPAAPAEPAAPAIAPSPSYVPPAPMRIAPTLSGGGFKSICPTCHVALQPAGTGNLAVCPQCGRLASARSATSEAEPTANPISVAPAPPSTSSGGSSSLADRRSQELFAAWVSQSPIPCPKCRTSLRHRGVGEYACPACGQTVRFPTQPSGLSSGPTPPSPPA